MPPTYEFVVIKLFNFSNEICLNMKFLFYSFVSKGPNREMHYINYKGNCKLPAHLWKQIDYINWVRLEAQNLWTTHILAFEKLMFYFL